MPLALHALLLGKMPLEAIVQLELQLTLLAAPQVRPCTGECLNVHQASNKNGIPVHDSITATLYSSSERYSKARHNFGTCVSSINVMLYKLAKCCQLNILVKHAGQLLFRQPLMTKANLKV